ncbi:ribosomal protein L6, alpha-beta domain-containing protein [Melampsora americana]|nr:ribosomal protein L6, alpha-beta domain-containing protein [Melampsora americana]
MSFASTSKLWASLASTPIWNRSAPRRMLSSTCLRLSHIGSKPVPIPATISLSMCNPPRPRTSRSSVAVGQPQLTVTGPLGKLSLDVASFVRLSFEPSEGGETHVIGADLPKTPLVSPSVDPSELPQVPTDTVKGPGTINVEVEDERLKKQRGTWGMSRALLANAVNGVQTGFTSVLKLVGVGYRASLEKENTCLNLRVGYSHPVLIELPKTKTFLGCELSNPTEIIIKGIDKQELGLLGASIRKWRPPEPYNGKGIYLNGETIKRKEAKKK